MMKDIRQGMLALASILDGRGQFDLSDRMERVSQLYPEELYGPQSFWFDQEHFGEEGRPWSLGEDIGQGVSSSEWETYKTPSGDRNDPRGTYIQHEPLDADEILSRVVDELREEVPGIDASDPDEFLSKLVFLAYMQLKQDHPDPAATDDELLDMAREDVSEVVRERFERVEEMMQENY
jgi:hypothetical protein